VLAILIMAAMAKRVWQLVVAAKEEEEECILSSLS
jgi:hypothetical protein